MISQKMNIHLLKELYQDIIILQLIGHDNHALYDILCMSTGKAQVTGGDGTVLEEKVLTGDVGDKYSSEELGFDGYELINRPSKANGKYTEDVITIKYKYQKIEEDNEPSDKDDNKVDSADINNIIMIITLLSCSIFIIGVTSKKEI